MPVQHSPRYLLFKVFLVVGALLSVLLLVQSIRTYRFVSGQLVRAALSREASVHLNRILYLARQADAENDPSLAGTLQQYWREESAKIVWLRLVDFRGDVLAEAGEPSAPPANLEEALKLLETGERYSEVRETPHGRVLVSLRPFRYRLASQRPATEFRGRPPAFPPPGREPSLRQGAPPPARGPRLNLLEIALRWNAVEAELAGLRRNLFVSVSAALALLAAMVVLGLRLNHYVRGKQLEQQLALSRKVQQELLPANPLLPGAVDVAAVCDPAWQIGGDFYDVFPVDHKRLVMLLGDVSGKGLPAALVMGMLHGAVRSTTWSGDPGSHEQALRRINELLCARTSVERFATMFWCYYDPEHQRLCYVNAGHIPPILARANTNADPELKRLEDGGPVLGVIPEAVYRQGEVEFRHGDLLVIYSDGVVEAANAAGEEFGEARLAAIIRDNFHRPVAQIRDEILRRVREFSEQQEQQDDLTLVVIRAGSPREEAARIAA